MVSLEDIREHNSRVVNTLPAGLVAVFAGATAGIGELALTYFVRHTNRPRIYFIGRSQEAGDRLQKELRKLNADGEYFFLKADLSLIKNVDEVCKEIRAKETSINVLFMSQGTLNLAGNTSEGLRYLVAVSYYSRLRMAMNLLPLVEAARDLRRVVTTMSAGFEGNLYLDHIADGKVPLKDARPHMSTLQSLAIEALAKRAPTVSFIHNFPGSVKTNLIRPEDGLMMRALELWFRYKLRSSYVPHEEVGERHAWLCTSGMFPDKENPGSNGGKIANETAIARGSDGVQGSGVYSLDGEGNPTSNKVVDVLRKYREEGAVESIWRDLENQFTRITGTVSI